MQAGIPNSLFAFKIPTILRRPVIGGIISELAFRYPRLRGVRPMINPSVIASSYTWVLASRKRGYEVE
jgi:hypothetical protein